MDGLKQVVLFTDGMDTRPYRLDWPTSTMIFDVSPQKVFDIASEKLQGVGARIPKICLFFRIPVESENIEHSLRSKGFSGNRPSIWAMQGLSYESKLGFEAILSTISSLAMHECYLIGELPAKITLQILEPCGFLPSSIYLLVYDFDVVLSALGFDKVDGETLHEQWISSSNSQL